MHIPGADRRRFTRVGFEAEAMLTQAGQDYPVQLLDISIKGLLVHLLGESDPGALSATDPANMTLVLADESEIVMQVSLAHRRGRDLGFRCQSVDIEGAAHLRRLIELNMTSPDAAAQVLEELLASTPDRDSER